MTKGHEPDESTLIRYLVGRASEAEADQLDELSVVDEEFALRLRGVEHDLVDAYVNGELTGETLEGFRSQYLRTPAGLAAVELAQALRGYRRAPAADRAAATDVPAKHRSWPAWALAAAALVLAASAYLLVDDVRLRRQMSGARETHAALEQRAQQLQEELTRQQAAARATEQELARAREAAAAVPQRAGDEPRAGGPLLALVLSAARRGGGDQLQQFAIPAGADTVVLRLPLVAVDFARLRSRPQRGDQRSRRLAQRTPASAVRARTADDSGDGPHQPARAARVHAGTDRNFSGRRGRAARQLPVPGCTVARDSSERRVSCPHWKEGEVRADDTTGRASGRAHRSMSQRDRDRVGRDVFAHRAAGRSSHAPRPGRSIERTLDGDAEHRYELVLKQGERAAVSVLQRGVDVVIRVIAPDGTVLGEFAVNPERPGRACGGRGGRERDPHADRQGPVSAQTPGDYRSASSRRVTPRMTIGRVRNCARCAPVRPDRRQPSGAAARRARPGVGRANARRRASRSGCGAAGSRDNPSAVT